ncbi:FMN-binding protein [Palleniella intestinalis]|jgi:FMN-binding domain.|uniref:FMN-binding protein n=1 Tax=Palleniella intestinalis TaxID=2736291 RepID=UPI0020A67A22|nr:FMN-binding protein [Palleniella intestinalis]
MMKTGMLNTMASRMVSATRSKMLALCGVAFLLCSVTVSADEVMTKNADGTYVVRTTTICNARGHRKGTPLEVRIKNNEVKKVMALKNMETVSYFARIKKNLLPLYENLKVSKARKLAEKQQVDGCTGATRSFTAVQKNIKAALDYYEKNK